MRLNPGLEPVHVESVGKHVKLGKHAKKHDRRNLLLPDYLTTPSGVRGLPPIPPYKSWSPKVAPHLQYGWGMMGNDTHGDCTCAGIGHAVQEWTALGGDKLLIDPTTDAVLGLYNATGSSDDGRVMLDVLNYVAHHGALGARVEAFVEVPKSSTSFRKLMRAAIDLFGGVYIGLELPLAAQTQKVWKATRGSNSAPGSWGGHAVWALDYDVGGVTLVTWGQLMRATWAFLDRYCDEAYALISPDWFAGGVAPSGFNGDALRADLQLIH